MENTNYHLAPELDLHYQGLGQMRLSGNPDKAQAQVFGLLYRKLRQTVSKEAIKLCGGLDDLLATAKSIKLVFCETAQIKKAA